MATPETPRSRAERRGTSRRSVRRRVIAIIGALVVVAGAGAFALSGGGHQAKVRASAPDTTTSSSTSTTTPTPPPAVIATSKVPQLQVFTDPNASSKVVTTLSAKTDYQLPRTLLVVQQTPGWEQALLPIRPNGTLGWIREGDINLTNTTYEIDISLTAHTLTLFNAGKPVVATPVVIGKQQTPTPTGKYYVTDPVDLQSHPNGAYGAFALGLSAFSDVLKSFNGGPGQIAVHGTPNQNDFGKDLSNGCVRIPNPVAIQIAKAVPLGTPVIIVA